MAQEISISLFERNAKIYNRKGLRRTFSSISTHTNEYLPINPLSARKETVIEVTIDKNSADAYQQFLKDNGFTILGDNNYYHLENACNDYDLSPASYQAQKEAIDKARADVEKLKKNAAPYREVKDEDVIFYFLPYNDVVKTLFEFIGAYKDKISDFAKKEDITIMMKISAFCDQVDGFFGFNFFDADQGDKEVIVDYASKINVKVNFNDRLQVYAAGVILAGIGDDSEELKAMNTSIVAENLKYTKE